jgi:tetratricopeptide (TPR) repeat protein/GTPase SAR1 family protein
MSVIQIRERGSIENSIELDLVIDGQDYGRVTVSSPFATEPQKDADLTWYFEKWLNMPLLEKVRAERAAKSVREYGESLFSQVFKDRDAYGAYAHLKHDLDRLEIEIIGTSPEFQAWHWEAMHDPQLPRPLAVDCRITRKYTQKMAIAARVQPSPVVNVLLVTARPDEEDDVIYRTISRSMVELIQNAHLRVNIEILRPATYKSLIDQLDKRGAGYYHILHFDGHGALLTYDQYQTGAAHDRYFFQRGYGLGTLTEYAGSKAFLFFDGAEKGQATPVEAKELADLLQGKQIPICILNACQSAMQLADTRETSLGSQLMAAGMQAVVAMGYSVTVDAAKVLMEKLYGELFSGKDFYTAVRLGRKELYFNKQRRGNFNTSIDLEDWLLPVVYGSGAVNLNLREFSSAETDKYYGDIGNRYRFEAPNYGFVGRDLEILKIEKALLRHNVLLLRGMGGTGKTTLLNYLREWWQTTDFALGVFYFGYDAKAWTLAQILFEIGGRVYDKYEQGTFVALNPQAQIQKLAQKLKATEYVLVLDNLESVTGQQLAIQNTLNAEQQQELRKFLGLLVGGKTKVVLGSRSGEEWLKDVFKTNSYDLRGLDAAARTDLAEKILKQHVVKSERIKQIRIDADFQRLMKLLAGYPLAMEVVLANLKHQSPLEIMTAMQVADVNLDNPDGQDKTSSILKCVEYSHSNLSESAQKLLLCLAPFSSFIDRSDLPNYGKQLQKLEPFQDYDFAGFDDAVQEAINWGLLSPMFEDGRLLSIQPVFPYFLQARLNQAEEVTREALREGFKNHYIGLAGSYSNLLESKDAEEKQLGIIFCRLEYENLYNALKICLDKQESFYSIYYCLYKYFQVTSDIQSRLKIAEEVNQALEKYPSELIDGELGQEAMIALDYLASAYLGTKQYEKARKSYEQKLEVVEALESFDTRQKALSTAKVYHRLGMVAQELRDWDKARANYRQALAIKVEFNDRFEEASTYHQLGTIAQELRDWDEARANYRQALAIKVEFNDQFSQASTYHQLGMVAQELRDWDEAHANYRQALAIFVEFNDRFSQASTYHQLGTVAQELRDWDEALANYRQALAIFVEFDDRFSQASTYHQLGRVAQELRDWDEALANYRQALATKVEFNDRYSQASTYHNLGVVAQELRDWNEARANYRQALAIYVEFNDRYEQSSTYHQLGMVAQELRDWDEALSNYHQALAIKVEFNDRYSQASTYHQLGIVAQELRDWDEALANYRQALAIYVEFNNRYSQAGTYHQLGMIAENEGVLEKAVENFSRALKIFIEFRDKRNIDIVKGSLIRIYHLTKEKEIIDTIFDILRVDTDSLSELTASENQTIQNLLIKSLGEIADHNTS